MTFRAHKTLGDVEIGMKVELGLNLNTGVGDLSIRTDCPYEDVTGPNPAAEITGRMACVTPADESTVAPVVSVCTNPLDADTIRSGPVVST